MTGDARVLPEAYKFEPEDWHAGRAPARAAWSIDPNGPEGHRSSKRGNYKIYPLPQTPLSPTLQTVPGRDSPYRPLGPAAKLTSTDTQGRLRPRGGAWDL